MEFHKDENGEEYLLTAVQKEDDGSCVKDFLSRRMSLSSTLIKKVKYGGVFVCGRNVTVREKVHTADTVKVVLPKEESEYICPIYHPIKVLYEDEHILAVDKPTNMPTHPSRGNSLTTLASAVRYYINEPFVFRAITRLDRDTSGIVLIAKNQYSAQKLSSDMKSGKIEKYYTALLSRVPEIQAGIIDAPIARECEGNIRRCVREDGKRAVTEYKVTEILPDGRAYCQIKLHTGRTHQIRVHFSHIGAPLYADFLYGKRIEGEHYRLRCTKCTFTHPITNEKIIVEA